MQRYAEAFAKEFSTIVFAMFVAEKKRETCRACGCYMVEVDNHNTRRCSDENCGSYTYP